MSNQILEVWAQNEAPDPQYKNNQRRLITKEEFLAGWGTSKAGITYHQLNQMLFLLTSASAPSYICPYPYKNTLPITDNMLHMNGQALVEEETPILFAAYGSTLEDLTASNLPGHIWVVRKQ